MKRRLVLDGNGQVVAKTCTKCDRELDVKCFHRRSRGRSSHCKDCKNASGRSLYKKNSVGVCARTNKYQAEKAQKVISILMDSACKDCGCSDFRVLEFDHLRDKRFGIGKGVFSRSWSQISSEIQKCEVVCRSCHRKRTALRANNYKVSAIPPTRAGQKYILEYLSDHPCVRCGESDRAMLEFHHRHDEYKVGAIAFLVNRKRPLEVIEKEVAKCDVLCANCHQLETLNEQGWRFRSTSVGCGITPP